MLKKNIKVVLNDCSTKELENLGEKVRMMRNEEGMSQQVLADTMLKDRSTLSKVESGVNMPSLQMLTEIADALGYKLSLNFEKVSAASNQELFDFGNMSPERKSLYVLGRYLEIYSQMLEDHYIGYNEDYIYHGKTGVKVPGYTEYHKNRLNFDASIDNCNKLDTVDEIFDQVKIYIDNPEDCFEFSFEWDPTIYMSVTSIIINKEVFYNIDLVKEAYCGGPKKVLFNCIVDTPINVIIASESIKKAYLEKVDLNTIDIKDEEPLKIPSKKLKSKFKEDLSTLERHIKKCLEYESVINQIDLYNSSDNIDYPIEYKLHLSYSNTMATTTFSIEYKGVKWGCYPKSNNSYEVSMNKNNEVNRKIEVIVDSPKEVVESIIKYS